ncbi:MotA/TolQ/ExbB proton channel family protein [Pseudorhodobacter sp. MZDSW-24AT]|uniref:MotA/TolQ/ExbB proton channel family protein n=1 Tax=Pseudorhodobacter sp. MZDSW-24AT TaxID=2052957 RepID=UPI000C1EB4C6|nr:MotA/TolQ/ExbB proton channel family protein [Pseudorhodobacter sp. MZDSW-24AT]PJF10555.1 MotA/TolQ/ExbB proton channel family protein [Pseudorhodobacter sp. MZDSW-24AT]
MIHLIEARDALRGLIELGGAVVALILALSVLAGAVVLWKLWQFRAAGVGRHAGLEAAIAAHDAGQTPRARGIAESAQSHLAPLLAEALRANTTETRDRLYTLAETRLSRLEQGFRLLDTVAQTAPLLGLFGTVLGMIDAFRAMQGAGTSVDPSVLAGGIWVALMTTAAGLAVAMPVSALLAWLESRMAAERRMAGTVIEAALCPGMSPPAAARAEKDHVHAPA